MNVNDVGVGSLGGQEGSPDRGGSLVIRTWLERSELSPRFRARITYGPVADAELTTLSAADPEQVLSIVRQWLLTQTG